MSPQTLKDYQRVVESIYIQEQVKGTRRHTFEIKNCFYLEAIPSEITLLQDIQTLKITNCTRLKTLPEELEYLDNLEELIFEGSKKIPKGFEHLPKLKSLVFINSPFLKNTNFKPLETVKAIQQLKFENCLQSVGQVPLVVFNITSIVELSLVKNQLTSLPSDILLLKQLKTLHLHNNPFHTFPAVLLNLPRLQYLSISTHALSSYTTTLLGLASISQLTITPIPSEEKSKMAMLQQLLKAIDKYNCTPSLQELLLRLIYHPNAIQSYTDEQLFEILDTSILPLQELALEQLTQKLPKPATIPSNTKIILKGKLNSKLNILKNRLEHHHLQLGYKITPQTDYILIGLHPNKNSWNTPKNSATLLTEKILLQYLNKTIPTYLSTLKEDDEAITHLKSLLLSNEENNILLGLEIIQSGGLPISLKEILFWVYKTQSQLNIKRIIRQLFSLYFPKSTYEILRSKKQLKATLSEKILARNIAFFCEQTLLEKLPLVQLVYQHWQKGIYFTKYYLTPREQAQFYDYFQLDTKTVKD